MNENYAASQCPVRRLKTGLAALILAGLASSSLLAAEPVKPASRSPIACQSSPDNGMQCGVDAAGINLKFSFDFIFDKDRHTGVSRAEHPHPDEFVYDAGPDCSPFSVIAKPTMAGLALSSQGSCGAPVQVCMNVQAAAPEIAMNGQIALVQSHGVTIGMQSDERFSTAINVDGKRIRFCTNPIRDSKFGWALELFAGSQDDVKNAFQSLRAPIRDLQGEVIGLSKTDPAVNDGYLFVDLTEQNADTVLPYVKLSGFRYVLIYASTWATSLGSYAFNPKNYPDGLAGLQKVVKAANAMGIKVGLHTLTSFVAKSDPYVSRRADEYLLKDHKSSILQRIDGTATSIVAADSLSAFPTQPAFFGAANAGVDLLIGKEVLSCPTIQPAEHGTFKDCKRGLYGTKASAHEEGTPIFHLAERYGSFLVDLRTDLKAEIGKRLAGIINDAGIDMVYFDGGEVGVANGEPGWFVAEQQIEILKSVHRPLLVEGSGIAPRLWPYLSRIVDDDFAALAPVTFLDEHKIGRVRASRVSMFMPDNLGWLGLLKETPAYPATAPEEISTFVARSLALGRPLAIETFSDSLLNNPYSSRLMETLAAGNRSLRSQALSAENRSLLGQGTWYYDADTGGASLRQFRRLVASASPEKARPASTTAASDEQNVSLRIRKIRSLSLASEGNLVLLDGQGGKRLLPAPAITASNRGLLAETISIQKSLSPSTSSSFVDLIDTTSEKKSLDMSSARDMLVEFDYGSAQGAASENACAVLNLQLQDNRGQFRDYLLPLAPGRGQRAILDYEKSAASVLKDYPPSGSSYPYKAAVYGFNFAAVTSLNLRWMSSCDQAQPLTLKKVSMLAETPSSIKDIRLNVEGRQYPVSASAESGQTLDVFPDGRVLQCKGQDCTSTKIGWPAGKGIAGKRVTVEYAGEASADVSLGLLGRAIAIDRAAR